MPPGTEQPRVIPLRRALTRSAAIVGLTLLAVGVAAGVSLGVAWVLRYIHTGPWSDGWDRYMTVGAVFAGLLSLAAVGVGLFCLAATWAGYLKRDRSGLCPRCGYDLRAQPAHDITCPECGAVTR